MTTETKPKKFSQWRTVIVALAGMNVLLLAYLFTTKLGGGWDSFAAAAFGSLCLWVAGICSAQAFKGSVDSVAQGEGIEGIKKNIMTDKKPGEEG